MREFMTGNDAVVRGAMTAGCDYFAGYPITPANSILTGMIRALSGGRGIAVQTEDEIAAIGQCIGASMAGAKVMTATSGPGLSLYSENIGLAQMGEAPLVIVVCQRMGPATGGATATAEGDVVFARHVTSGGYPLPVLAACDAESAYRLTVVAFNLAERLRTPVILLSSKDIAMTRQTVDLDAIELPAVEHRATADPDLPFQPYAFAEPTDIPRFAPIGGPQRVRFTGSIHNEQGLLTIDRTAISRKLTHLLRKGINRNGMLEFTEADIDPDAETLVLCYGQTSGSVRDAVDSVRSSGARASRLTLFSLWPIPEQAIRRAITHRVKRVLMPELNIGLYADEMRRIIHGVKIEPIIRYDGGQIRPETIAERITNWPCG